MSLHVAKLLTNPLVGAGAALIISIGAATAADSRGDAQQQARALLTGTAAAHSGPQSAPRDGKVTRPTATASRGDAQQQARALLTGTAAHSGPQSPTGPGATARQAGPVVHGDAQAAARQLLLGQHTASDASRLAARRTR